MKSLQLFQQCCPLKKKVVFVCTLLRQTVNQAKKKPKGFGQQDSAFALKFVQYKLFIPLSNVMQLVIKLQYCYQ